MLGGLVLKQNAIVLEGLIKLINPFQVKYLYFGVAAMAI